MTETSALLPCPFCGTRPILLCEGDMHSVACPHYYCNFSQIPLGSEKKAADRWNTRAAAPSPEPVAWMRSWTDGDSSFSPASRGKPKEIEGTTLTALGPLSQFAENANWSAMRKALEEIANRNVIRYGGRLRCHTCGYKSVSPHTEERHAPNCARQVALAALSSSPALVAGSHNSGEADPSVTQACGGGDPVSLGKAIDAGIDAINIDRLSSIWDDVRIRLNVRKDYYELASAIDLLLGKRGNE